MILVLEELGIPRETFEKMAALPFKITWWDGAIQNDLVEVLVTVNRPINEELLSKYPNVKLVVVAFTGYDCVDLNLCRQKNIAVYNVPHYSTQSVAELSVGLAISLLREIPRAHNLVKSERWELKPGRELAGKTIGILGTGAIGILTARYFKALGCKVIGWSRKEKSEFRELADYASDLRDFFATSDIVSIHLPLTPETRSLVGITELSVMKPSAFLINTARGPIVDEAALHEVLSAKKIAGAALDVFDQEPLPADSPLRKLENLILTPHIAYKTEEALERRAGIAVENVHQFLRGEQGNRVA